MSELLKRLIVQKQHQSFTGYEIERIPTGRILIISDIHGYLKTLKALIQQIKLTKNDQLFFVGDYIDRGPDSLGVLDYMINLIQEGYNIYPVRGNHEQTLLNNYFNFKRFKIYAAEFDEDEIDDEQIEKYINFVSNLPIYYKIENIIIVHAGINFKSEDPFSDFQAMMTIRASDIPEKDFEYRIIHGHTILKLSDIESNILSENQVLNLDNGCYYRLEEGYGNLLCYDVGNSIVYKERNTEV